MKKNHQIWICFAFAFFALLYSVLLFVLKKSMSTSNWIAYGFTIIAFLIQILSYGIREESTKAFPFFSILSNKICLVYFAVQFLVGGIISMVLSVSSITMFVVGIVILLLYIISALIIKSGTSSIKEIDEFDYQNVARCRKMVAEMQTCEKLLYGSPLSKKVNKLREEIMYSDPVTDTSINGMDKRIENNILLLREEAEDREFEKVEKRLDKLDLLISERKALVMASKK